MEDVGGGEKTDEAGQDFVFSPIKQLCAFLENERELVALTIRQHYFREVSHDFLGSLVHQFEASHIVGFFEPEQPTKLGESSAVDPHYHES